MGDFLTKHPINTFFDCSPIDEWIKDYILAENTSDCASQYSIESQFPVISDEEGNLNPNYPLNKTIKTQLNPHCCFTQTKKTKTGPNPPLNKTQKLPLNPNS